MTISKSLSRSLADYVVGDSDDDDDDDGGGTTPPRLSEPSKSEPGPISKSRRFFGLSGGGLFKRSNSEPSSATRGATHFIVGCPCT